MSPTVESRIWERVSCGTGSGFDVSMVNSDSKKKKNKCVCITVKMCLTLVWPIEKSHLNVLLLNGLILSIIVGLCISVSNYNSEMSCLPKIRSLCGL